MPADPSQIAATEAGAAKPALSSEKPPTAGITQPPTGESAGGDSDQNPVTAAAKRGATSEHPEKDLQDVAAGGEVAEPKPQGTETTPAAPKGETAKATTPPVDENAIAERVAARMRVPTPSENVKGSSFYQEYTSANQAVEEYKKQHPDATTENDPQYAALQETLTGKQQALAGKIVTELGTDQGKKDGELHVLATQLAGEVSGKVATARFGDNVPPEVQEVISQLASERPEILLKIFSDPDQLKELGARGKAVSGRVLKGLPERIKKRAKKTGYNYDVLGIQADALFGNGKVLRGILKEFPLDTWWLNLLQMLAAVGVAGTVGTFRAEAQQLGKSSPSY